MKKEFFLLMILSFLWCSCTKSVEGTSEEYFNMLKENEAIVSFKIDGKEFYKTKQIFTPNLNISPDLFSIVLNSRNGDMTMINMGLVKWDASKLLSFEIKQNDPSAANIKIGKMVDTEKMIGEGYMMTEGVIKSIHFSRDKMIFEISGRAGKYSDFQQPDKYQAVEGLIVCKQPKINMTGVSDVQIFGTH